MKYTAVIAAFAAVASAQSVTSTASSAPATGTSSCAAQNILDACKATIQGQINSCSQQDWGCLCTQYVNLQTCYNNCPGDLEAASVQQQRDQYCNFASVYSSSSTKYSAASTSATSATSTSSDEETVQTGFGSASGSGSQSATTSASGNGAAAATQIAANVIFAGAAAAYMFL